ncbi:MAG: amidohydrolase family protein [Alphaproteobacteria bacterium]
MTLRQMTGRRHTIAKPVVLMLIKATRLTMAGQRQAGNTPIRELTVPTLTEEMNRRRRIIDDLGDRLTLPGFIDTHSHPVIGTVDSFALFLDKAQGIDEWLSALRVRTRSCWTRSFLTCRSLRLTMIRGYTIDGAYQLHMEDRIGSVEVGKDADLVVLDQNLFEVDKYEIHKTQVEMTVMNGETTYLKSD